MKKFSLLFLVIIILLSYQYSLATQLGDLASSMQPGTWAILNTNNIDQTFKNTGGSSNSINPYSDKMVWDTTTGSGYFMGSDHGGNLCSNPQSSYRLVRYSATLNTWEILSLPPWYVCPDPGYSDAHGYHKIAIDRNRRELYRNPYSTNNIHIMNLDTGVWTSYLQGGQACCKAIEFNETLGGLLIQDTNGGGIELWNTTTHTSSGWIAANTNFAGTTWTTITYNPVTRETLFFDGRGYTSKMDGNGVLITIPNPPFLLKTSSASPGIVIADPISGEWLALAADSFVPYKSIDGIKWDINPNLPPVNLSANGPGTYKFVIATEIPENGVVMYVYCGEINSSCGVLLYKHSIGTTVPFTIPLTPSQLMVQ